MRSSLSEGTARFWNVVIAAVTAFLLLSGGAVSAYEFLMNQTLQIAATKLSARKNFNDKLLDLCTQASQSAAQMATATDAASRKAAEDKFWSLFFGPLAIVEQQAVKDAMKQFGACLRSPQSQGCSSLEGRALDIGHACRSEVTASFELQLQPVSD
jgi:hypothetical protein